MTLQEAYRYCEQVMKEGSLTFFKAFSLLDVKDRQAVAAVYTFCRTLDDTVDESLEPEESLQRFLEEFEQFLEGVATDDPLWVALADVWSRYEMDETPFWELAEGMTWDLHKTRYETLAETERYSYFAASTVGLMLLPILVPDAPFAVRDEIRQGAIDLGIAMQLTNILRDVGEDLERGRIYLPAELMSRHGVSEEMLASRGVTPEFVTLWEELAERAETLYDRAGQTHRHYPKASRRPVQAASVLYRAILDAARANGHDVFAKRAVVSTFQKGKLLAKLAVQAD